MLLSFWSVPDRPSSGQASCGWTVETLKAHLESLLAERDRRTDAAFGASKDAVSVALNAQEKAVDAAMKAAGKAAEKAEASSNERFAAVNEFRQSLNDMVAHLIPRAEADARLTALTEKLDLLQLRVTSSEGRSKALGDGWGWLLGVVGIGIAIATLVAKLIV